LKLAKMLGITAESRLVPALKGVLGVSASRHRGGSATVDDPIQVEGGRR
jgi:hypothetical protein